MLEARARHKKIIAVVASFLCALTIADMAVGISFYVLKHLDNGKTYYKFFSYGDAYFSSIEKNKEYFLTFINDYYDPATGWNNPRSQYHASTGCRSKWEAYYNEDGSRKTCHASPVRKYDIICVGDSFTHGNETDDGKTFPAILQKLLKLNVGNFGVGGYDTVQSVLQYEAVLSRVDPPKVGILGIMYENGRRNLNSFRPVYVNYFDLYEAFLFKPYFDGKQINDPVIRHENTFEHYKSQAHDAFINDFWAKPKLTFPFSISLFKSLHRPSFTFQFRQKINHILHNGTYSYDYQTPIILNGIRHCVDRFVNISMNRNILPVVVFIPPSARDITSPDSLASELQARYPQSLILNFGKHNMDWEKYSLGEGCHPTPDGYEEIAKFLSSRIVAAQKGRDENN
ncbi:MAG: hypothetical protein C0394_00355 [Syntrophus sp. (in: bacteria)]|nr:hypothetical protein [Syntrophus sp. (in: bacteria)]